ncbi:MAG: CDP-alcohol phosphatidyltransferase family protein [Candidatus Electrothrix sp. AR4]|nr:CDP-alcohol phosphatidyltransferase family protein [Candidatus Electrothrix sp. AR4]
MNTREGRRPLKVRDTGFVQKTACYLSGKNITPNQISISSVFLATSAAACLVLLPYIAGTGKWLLPILAAVFIQCRLLCNLFDGMVAIEGGKTTPSGELFNDIPDRIADPLILIAAGYAIIPIDGAETVGWFAGLLSVFTAYIRTLSVSISVPADFRGPMAKQHRMALMTIACILTSFEGFFWQQGYILFVSLWLIVIGSVITVFRRIIAAYRYMESK